MTPIKVVHSIITVFADWFKFIHFHFTLTDNTK